MVERVDVLPVPDPDRSHSVQRVYLLLTVLSTLATSLIWGINTLFLLDAGLSNTEAFAANAFFTVGQVLFEIPTGVVADTRGRRLSYLLGAGTLLISTVLYLVMWEVEAPLWGWAIASIMIGLGFTFFTGATEAWLVDGLAYCGFSGELEHVFARTQTWSGAAMLVGSLGGGFIAQFTSLGVPYLLRALALGITLTVALVAMRDYGFIPKEGRRAMLAVRQVLSASIESGWRNPPVRWTLLESAFSTGVGFYAFYAMQPFLLELYGDESAVGVAGIAAAAYAGAQIVGGLLVPHLHKMFTKKTSVMLFSAGVSALAIGLVGAVGSIGLAIALMLVWSLVASIALPIRQAYLNGQIPSEQRATVLSFDSLMGSSGGILIQPGLGRVADVAGYPAAFFAAGVLRVGAIPFLALARRAKAVSDPID
ncbi:MAG: MFS transporter [Actinomycetota bacterium]